MQNGNINFEKAIERLDEIIKELNREGIPLDEALTLYEEGVSLAKICNARLEETERRIKILQISVNGEIEEKDFSAEQTECRN